MAHKSSDAGSDSRRNINKDAEQTTTIGTGRGRERDGDRCQMEGQKRALFGQNCRLHEDFRSIFGGHLNGGTPPLLLLLRRPLQRCRPRCRRSRPTLATAANQSPTLQQNFPKSEEKKKKKKTREKEEKNVEKTRTLAHTRTHTQRRRPTTDTYTRIYICILCARVCGCAGAFLPKPNRVHYFTFGYNVGTIESHALRLLSLDCPQSPAGRRVQLQK